MPNRFETSFISSLPIPINISRLSGLANEETYHYTTIGNMLDYLTTFPGEYAEPIFVYAHLMMPHEPYIFSADGEFDPSADYFSQVEFIDSEMIRILEEILENSVEPPIIILQGDHGYKDCSVSILNAYFFPNADVEDVLYPRISPVNSFRVVFNTYFQGDYDLLRDEIFIDRYELITHVNEDIAFDFELCNYDFEAYECK